MLNELNSINDHDPPSEQLPLEEISSALSDQILQLCDDPQFLQETLHDSEVTSCSNLCQEDNTNNLSLSLIKDEHADIYPATTADTTATSSTTTATTNTTSNPSTIFDPGQEEIENDISVSINFSPSPSFSIPPMFSAQQQDQLDFSLAPQPQVLLTNFVSGAGLTQNYPKLEPVVTLVGPALPPVFEEDCLSSMPPVSFMPLSPSSSSCSFLSPGIMGTDYMPGPGNVNAAALPADGSRIFMGSLLLNNELQPEELDYEGDTGGIYCPDSVPCVFNPNSIKAFPHETQKLVSGPLSGSPPLAAEISSLEDSTFKVGKLSVEQRKEKIHRYMKKRNERNFSKKIKYACRKTLADSRPRVRGRFAKNDDFSQNHSRLACSSHEEDDKDEVDVKEEEDMIDSSDIFAHISGVNSFKCNYSIQSWI
ncbi:uncharacterized protein LOC116206874 [Punica granatum]|uniref:Uncharacterized protein LOC116206874 n=1 Tax=Punica granatum TaxID=22663 RepID=A0A218Y2R6_PUNGR|nr:uncharacterized protein LOC116206874 [Punica granatum]OWM91575.1 hypothetical protein CDL15_Pgr012334 [Punica granatum]